MKAKGVHEVDKVEQGICCPVLNSAELPPLCITFSVNDVAVLDDGGQASARRSDSLHTE